MAYEDWTVASPADHTKFKAQPGHVRTLRVDLAARLTAILYGFASGETYVGIKKARLITVGTGTPSAPTGTGSAADIDVYAKTYTIAEACLIDINGDEMRLTRDGHLYLYNARLFNNEWFMGLDTGNANDVNIFKINSGNAIEFASHPIAPDTGPSSALQYVPKGYVDGGAYDARIKAWINFNGAGEIAISDSFNVTSIADEGTGDYTITWDRDFADTKYCIVGTAGDTAPASRVLSTVTSRATGTSRIRTIDANHNPADSNMIYLAAIGDQ